MTVKLREKKEILHFEAQVELEEHITSMALTGFSSRFEADGYDLKVGGLAIECLSYHPLFPGKEGGSILEVAGFFSPPPAVNRELKQTRRRRKRERHLKM